MKGNKNIFNIGFPAQACEKSCLSGKDTLELYADKGVFIFIKNKMTALELANTMNSLSSFAADLGLILANACGVCNNCGDDVEGCDDFTDCCDCEECKNNPAELVKNCSLCRDLLDENQIVKIPDCIREKAGISVDAKLEAFTGEDSGKIIVTKADNQQDINDVPRDIINMLVGTGICIAELNDLILEDRIVYGE